jgi:hypothetical protein
MHDVRAFFIANLQHDHPESDSLCRASYALTECVGNWGDLQNRISVLSSTHSIISSIKEIAMNTINSSYSWSNTKPQPGDTAVIQEDEARGHCVNWVNNVWNQIAKLPGAIVQNDIIYFTFGDGTAIAIQPELLDYNGNIPTFTSHAVLRLEVGYVHTNIGGAFIGDGLVAVTYLDNNLYGGIDRIFNYIKAEKSLLPYYPDNKTRTLLDNSLYTPSMWIN